MSSLLTIVFLTWGILFIGFLPAFLVWNRFFNKDPFEHSKISRWSRFRKKKPFEIQLESAKALLSQGAFNQAENEYRVLFHEPLLQSDAAATF